MALNDIYRLDATILQDGKEWLIGFYYRVSVDDATKTPVVVAAAMATDWQAQFWTGNIDQLCSDQAGLVGVTAQMFHPTLQFAVTQPYVFDAGAVALVPLPAHSCQLIHQSGLVAGRSFQGRAYLSGIPTSFEDNGVLTVLAESEFVAHGATPFGANTWQPIGGSPLVVTHTNFSKKRANAVPPTPPFWSDLQLATLRPTLGTQRGRVIATETFAP